MKKRKLLESIINNPTQVRFKDLLAVAHWLGCETVRVSGSHHILVHNATSAMVNIQVHGDQAKPYQGRQFLKLIEERRIAPKDSE